MATIQLDLNEQFQRACFLMAETNKNVFITGRAGTGKSTLLNYFRKNTKKKAVVLAPTGVAAINVSGQTIHSFFKFKPSITLQGVKKKYKDGDEKNLYAKLEVIIIDEISMVRADLLDCVDRFLRLNGPDKTSPFGGIQMIFIGDLYQLPPVVIGHEREIFREHYKSPYFFSANVFENLEMEMVELEKIYRQTDDEFIRLLNTIRNNSAEEIDLAALNERCDPEFSPAADDFYICLTSTNDQADKVNREELQKLRGKKHVFSGFTEGEFGKEYLPTALELELKIGAQVMMLNNDSGGRWVNGTIGKIIDIQMGEMGEEIIVVDLDNGKRVEVSQHTWEISKFFLKDGQLDSEMIGSFTQYPLRLAFAVTIHKSQGKTFQKVIIDIGRGTFAHGQMYVALSRCTTFEGMVLRKPIQKHHIRMDYEVVKFITRYQYETAEKQLSREDKIEMIQEAIERGLGLEITYLKAKDEKSRRTVRPLQISNMEYSGHPFLGMTAYCLTRGAERVFNVDRILEMRGEG